MIDSPEIKKPPIPFQLFSFRQGVVFARGQIEIEPLALDLPVHCGGEGFKNVHVIFRLTKRDWQFI